MTDRDANQESALRQDIGGDADSAALWRELAVTAQHPQAAPDGKALAEWLREHGPGPEIMSLAIARVLYGSIEALGDTTESDIRRLSDFVGHLELPLLTSALRRDFRVGDRAALLRISADALSVRALLRLLEASWSAGGRTLTVPLQKLVPKLARSAVGISSEDEDGARAERLFRDVVAGAFDSLAGRSPYGAPAPSMSFRAPPHRRAAGRAAVDADRVIKTAIETGAAGPAVSAAVAEMIEEGRTTDLLDLLRGAPDDSPAAMLIRSRVATLAELERLLAQDPVDFATADIVIAGLGIAAAKPLIEAITESASRTTRRGAFERLARIGPDIAPLVESRLRDSRWFVVRNMIALLREAGVSADVASIGRFTSHADPRVRREALMLLFGRSETRDHAICEALKDADRHVLRLGLQAARSGLPDAAVPTLARRLTSGEFPPEFRVLALHLLGRTQSTLALDALLHFAQAGRSLVGRPKLAPKSPEMLAAVSSLARGWPHEQRAAALIAAAAKSRDEQIREATRGAPDGTSSA